MEIAASEWFLPCAGMLAGFTMGFAARRQHFCTMSALERHWYTGDSAGLRTWALAGAVALVLTQTLAAYGYAGVGQSFYLSTNFAWSGYILGGLAFGFGMALVGTCGFGALVRTGGGSLRSIIVLIVLGLSAMAAQKGIIAQGRVLLVDDLAIDLSGLGDQSLGSVASALLGFDVGLAVVAVVAVAMFWWIFKDASYRRRKGSIAAGAVIGCAIAFGWVATTYASNNSFDLVQIEASSFVVPVADTILQFVAYTGVFPDYGVGLVVGVVLGSAACAWSRRDVRWEACDDARELSRHLAGGFLMGVGGVFAMGCTIGQGVTAISAMALSAPVVLLSIAVGARMGLSYLIEGSVFSAFRTFGNEPAE